jgi:hypothetical protein
LAAAGSGDPLVAGDHCQYQIFPVDIAGREDTADMKADHEQGDADKGLMNFFPEMGLGFVSGMGMRIQRIMICFIAVESPPVAVRVVIRPCPGHEFRRMYSQRTFALCSKGFKSGQGGER